MASALVPEESGYWYDLAVSLSKPQPGMQDAVFRKGNVLRLDPGFYVPGMDSLRTCGIWVHEHYVVLAATIQDRLLMKTEQGFPLMKNFHLVGSSGIGKSIFGLLWLYYQATQNRKVVYRTKGGEFAFFDFSGNKPVVCTADNLRALRNFIDRSTWIIIDGKSDYVASVGPILQCVSDTTVYHHEFAKQGGLYLYMEAWSLDDCVECAADLGLNAPDMLLRYYYVGGAPRYIFYMQPQELKDLVDKAFDSVNTEDKFNYALKNPDAPIPGSDILFHFKYPNDYLIPELSKSPSAKTLNPASEYVLDKADKMFFGF